MEDEIKSVTYILFGDNSGKNDFGIIIKLKIPAIAVMIIIAFA